MKLRSLFGFGLAWGGYLLMWWGYAQWKNVPTPLADLALPGRSGSLPGDLRSTKSAQALGNQIAQSGPNTVAGAVALGAAPPVDISGITSASGPIRRQVAQSQAGG